MKFLKNILSHCDLIVKSLKALELQKNFKQIQLEGVWGDLEVGNCF